MTREDAIRAMEAAIGMGLALVMVKKPGSPESLHHDFSSIADLCLRVLEQGGVLTWPKKEEDTTQ